MVDGGFVKNILQRFFIGVILYTFAIDIFSIILYNKGEF